MRRTLIAGMILLAGMISTCEAATRYVSLDGGNSYPYTNWATAATDISGDLLWNSVVSGDIVVVSNGTYHLTAPRRVNVSVTITGAYGAAQTILDGSAYNGGAGSDPPFWNSYTITITFCDLTFSNFPVKAIRAGGIAHYVKNCVLVNNSSDFGAGIYCGAGGSFYATNCVIRGNTSIYGGGGVYFSGITGRMDNCEIENNRLINTYTDGGGVHAAGSGFVMRNSRIAGNTCGQYGGGVYLGASNAIYNCLVTGNSAENLRGDGGGVALYGVMRNCTVVSNSVARRGGGVFGTGTSINSIVYFNLVTNTSYLTTSNYVAGPVWVNSCTAPLPAGAIHMVTNNPMLVNVPGGNFRLTAGSPCINAGTNESWMDTAVDLDGRPRIREGTVDMGVYEWFPKGTVIKLY